MIKFNTLFKIICEQIDTPWGKSFDNTRSGSCMIAAEMLTNHMLNRGIENFTIIEGYVKFKNDKYNTKLTHTWIVYNNKIIDPTKEQFQSFGFDISQISYITKTTYTPEQYLNLCKLYPVKSSPVKFD